MCPKSLSNFLLRRIIQKGSSVQIRGEKQASKQWRKACQQRVEKRQILLTHKSDAEICHLTLLKRSLFIHADLCPNGGSDNTQFLKVPLLLSVHVHLWWWMSFYRTFCGLSKVLLSAEEGRSQWVRPVQPHPQTGPNSQHFKKAQQL